MSWFLPFFLIIDLYFVILAVTNQLFNPTVKLVTPTGIPTTELKEEIKTHSAIAEATISKCWI